MSALERFVTRLPRRPYAADDPKREGVRVLGREQALSKRHIQIGSSNALGYLTYDIDFAGGALAHEDAEMLPPTITVLNPENAHAHLLYEIRVPVTGDSMSPAKRYATAIEEAMRWHLGADPGYAGLLVKNPLHPHWRVFVRNDARYSLGDLAAQFDSEDLRFSRSPREINVLGRNVELFNLVRHWAYRQVSLCASFAEFEATVVAYTTTCNNNNFVAPLRSSELRSISKSIVKWTWSHRLRFARGVGGVRRGVLGFEVMPPVMDATKRLETVRERQSAGAAHANRSRRAATAARITAAVAKLVGGGKKVTVTSVARVAGVSRETISRRYRTLIKV